MIFNFFYLAPEENKKHPSSEAEPKSEPSSEPETSKNENIEIIKLNASGIAERNHEYILQISIIRDWYAAEIV